MSYVISEEFIKHLARKICGLSPHAWMIFAWVKNLLFTRALTRIVEQIENIGPSVHAENYSRVKSVTVSLSITRMLPVETSNEFLRLNGNKVDISLDINKSMDLN